MLHRVETHMLFHCQDKIDRRVILPVERLAYILDARYDIMFILKAE